MRWNPGRRHRGLSACSERCVPPSATGRSQTGMRSSSSCGCAAEAVELAGPGPGGGGDTGGDHAGSCPLVELSVGDTGDLADSWLISRPAAVSSPVTVRSRSLPATRPLGAGSDGLLRLATYPGVQLSCLFLAEKGLDLNRPQASNYHASGRRKCVKP